MEGRDEEVEILNEAARTLEERGSWKEAPLIVKAIARCMKAANKPGDMKRLLRSVEALAEAHEDEGLPIPSDSAR